MDLPSSSRSQRLALVVDDEKAIREMCSRVVASCGAIALTAGTGAEAMSLLRTEKPQYVFLDVNLPDTNGMKLLREIRAAYPEVRVVMITGLATVEMAVEAMKIGAYDYLRKPNIVEQICQILREPGAGHPRQGPQRAASVDTRTIVGISQGMARVRELIRKAADWSSTVLIEGESGTGKELVARAIHELSRPGEPFVPVDCGAIAPTLIESELFGHVAGAFTDARKENPGLLRSAGAGTVFLDEIGELPQAVQVKLLRALQEMEVRPVGGVRAEPLRARIIAATNRDLSQAVALGQFRRDLFYRLHVIPIFVPPLRERREDIPLLVEHFLRICAESSARPRTMSVDPEAMERLMRYDWPGNVRELENFIRRAFALLDGDVITAADVDELFCQKGSSSSRPATEVSEARPSSCSGLLAERTAEAIRLAIQKAHGNKRQAARELGIGIATLYRKMRKYGIETR